ncbi:hypothetical protein [Comamonas squillarum]|uniref:Replication protein n=1 Tax=Comamonas squillarum TaxID=2977320 RepID=A0ABY5ZYQ9_9BURK|nr:hypothetical protein [Comamonas sp. PR12]UXC19137.1 hypothetical protein N4T19_03150 [Comamonas sp. PR12]
MRDYAKVVPKMWHGKTIKALRRSPEGLVVALYLMSSPSSNMLGLFAQPVLYMAHETGLGQEGAMKGLQKCVEVGYCSYDEDSEFVWVHEMASYQIASELKASDLRCKGIQKDYDALPDNPFLGVFFDRYQQAFHLERKRGNGDSSKAPSKALRSQEQEQEQEQDTSSSLRSEKGRVAKSPAPSPSGRQKREETTLAKYLADCREKGVKPVPDDHSVRTWAQDAGISDEMLQVAWVVFRERYTEDSQYKAKRYKDWVGTFTNSVKDRWFSLWFTGEGGVVSWSSTGLQHKQVLDARAAKRKEQEAAHATA